MRIGDKLFPYPTLNRDQSLSGYNENSIYKLSFETTKNGDLIKNEESVILKNIHFILNNSQLLELYDNKKLKCALIVECSSSLYRESYLIDTLPKDIYIPLDKLNDLVNISAYMYATEEINDYYSNDFNDDYLGYKFDLEGYDIVAIDDGYKFRIDIESEEDNKVSSIFRLVRADSNAEIVNYENGKDIIYIYLSPSYYEEYEPLKTSSYANNIVFAILLIPVLSKCLDEIKTRFEESDDIEEIIEQKKWFKSICINYEKLTGLKLTMDEFREKDSFDIAQLLLNNSSCNGLKDLNSFLFNGLENGEEDE